MSAHDIGDAIPQHSLDSSKVDRSAVRSCAEDAHMTRRIDHASVAAKKHWKLMAHQFVVAFQTPPALVTRGTYPLREGRPALPT